jgi:hypothetical protein
VLKNWQLPESFAQLRQALEDGHGRAAGARQYIRVLQLLAEHPPERVRQAVEDGLGRGQAQAERIHAEVVRLAEADGHKARATPGVTSLCQYQVPRPDLGQFDQLLYRGEAGDEYV